MSPTDGQDDGRNGQRDGSVGPLRLRRPDPSAGKLAMQVYEELRGAICDYRIPPNERLVQNALAEQLGISRTPVREALSQLAQEGLVYPAPVRGGFIVAEFTPQEVIEIYEVRLALEPLAARQAAGRHSRAQLAELRDVNASIAESDHASVEDQYRLNQRFHELVVDPSPNHILKRMLTQLWQMPSSLRMYHMQTGEDEQRLTVRQHAGIIEALESGDADLVEERVYEHIAGAQRLALEHFERVE